MTTQTTPRTLIMAQGQATRWAGPGHKCLCEIAKQPQISRTIQQLRTLGVEDIVVVGEVALFDDVVDTAIYEIRQPSPEVCHGIRDTAHLWVGQERIIILLGDTTYSWALLRAILSDDAPMRIYGRIEPNAITGKFHSERYAIAFSGELQCRNVMLRALERAIKQKTFPPTLRPLKEALDREWGEWVMHPGIVRDYTDDIDSHAEWLEIAPRLEAAIAEEERTMSR